MENEKPMNLLTDSWLQVTLTDGTSQSVSMRAIGRSDLSAVKSPRTDFRGALYQLMIGVLQTMFAPADREEWIKYWREPPKKEQLDVAFVPYLKAFNIYAPIGEPAFMQDLELDEAEDKPISQLFIEAPGGKTLKDNQDHFIKRDQIKKLSPEMAALALFTLQINAPAGGVGHRVSLRGGGPLTTLVLPPDKDGFNTLWHRLWLNVLTLDEIYQVPGNVDKTDLEAIFPWMGKTRTSEKKGLDTYPEHASPLQAYWSMPRRIRLNWLDEGGECDLTGKTSSKLVDGFRTRNYGTNYAGSWVHPLTPYAFEDGKEPLSIKGQPGGLGYRHWLGLVVEEHRGKQQRLPAIIVKQYAERQSWISDDVEVDFNPRLWAFGYDMDNMKARCWYESEMPIFNLEQDQRDDAALCAEKMINAASDVVKTLKSALKSAWFKRPADAKGDLSFIDSNFWLITEMAFYDLLKQLVENLDDREKINLILSQWRKDLTTHAHSLFDQYALASLNEDGDMKRIVKARIGKGGLEHYLNGSKSLKQLSL